LSNYYRDANQEERTRPHLNPLRLACLLESLACRSHSPAEVTRLLKSYGEQVRPACAKASAKASEQVKGEGLRKNLQGMCCQGL